MEIFDTSFNGSDPRTKRAFCGGQPDGVLFIGNLYGIIAFALLLYSFFSSLTIITDSILLVSLAMQVPSELLDEISIPFTYRNLLPLLSAIVASALLYTIYLLVNRSKFAIFFLQRFTEVLLILAILTFFTPARWISITSLCVQLVILIYAYGLKKDKLIY